MRRIAVIILAVAILASQSWALESSFLDIRNRVFMESKSIKSIFTINKDIVIISSMWDTCMVIVTQLDAYFQMVQIYNTIPQKQVTKPAVQSLVSWLNEIKRTNSLTLELLSGGSLEVEADTALRIERLKSLIVELNSQIDRELVTLNTLGGLLKR